MACLTLAACPTAEATRPQPGTDGHAAGRLVGEIPAELGSLSNLKTLLLSGNDLSGEIPPELGSLPLFSLTLEGNDFSGCVPSILERRLRNDPDPLPFC